MSQILGVLFAALIGFLIIPTFSQYQQISNENNRAVATAQQQQQLTAAAAAYIQQNATAIQANATPTNPAIISVLMLRNTGVLPTSFGALNPYGQTWQVQILQPAAGILQALALATGGTAIPDRQASKIAGIVGAAGGFVPLNDSGLYASGQAYGAYGGWLLSTAGYNVSGGHPAARVSYSTNQAESNYLYRNSIAGQPQLNRMNTALDMGANDVNNAGAVNATTANASTVNATTINAATANADTVNAATATISNIATMNQMNGQLQITAMATEGSACVGEGRVASSTTTSGLILSCQSGVWHAVGGEMEGLFCGISYSGYAVTPCKSHNPWHNCPPGYTRYLLGRIGSAYSATCVKGLYEW